MAKTVEEKAYYKQIGKNIKQLRGGKDLTQKDLASVVGVTFQQIQKYEKGDSKMDVFKLNELAKLFDINLDDLCNGTFELSVKNESKNSEL